LLIDSRFHLLTASAAALTPEIERPDRSRYPQPHIGPSMIGAMAEHPFVTEMEQARLEKLEIAVLIPCFNEEQTVGKVVRDFRSAVPQASVYVCDNNSTDATIEVARAAGASIYREPL